MSETQRYGIGFVWSDQLRLFRGFSQSGEQQVEVAYGPALAALRLDRERLEWLMKQYDKACSTITLMTHGAITESINREKIDAAMEEKR